MPRDGGLRKIYRQYLPHVHWTSIESPLTQSGIPDTNYCHNGVEGWIENKVIRSGDTVTMQAGQPGWLERHARAGGRVFIAVRWPRADDSLLLLRPEAGRLLLATGILKLPTCFILGRYYGGPAKWQWPNVAHILGIA